MKRSLQEDLDTMSRIKNVPYTWIPVKESNQSKLTCHYFKDNKWVRTPYTRFVPWLKEEKSDDNNPKSRR